MRLDYPVSTDLSDEIGKEVKAVRERCFVNCQRAGLISDSLKQSYALTYCEGIACWVNNKPVEHAWLLFYDEKSWHILDPAVFYIGVRGDILQYSSCLFQSV